MKKLSKIIIILMALMAFPQVSEAAFTANKSYNNQTTGTNTNTWGVVLNSNFTTIDSNLGGTLTLSVAGNSNVTLTSAQAANLIYDFTGVLTGNINVIFPAAGGLYFIDNATTGSYTLTVQAGASSSGILIPQGFYSPVVVDNSTSPPTLYAISATALTGTTLNSTITTSNGLVNFGGTGSQAWNFVKSNSGTGTNIGILNNNTANSTSAGIILSTGTSNALTDLYQLDGSSLSTNLTCGSGNTGGINISSALATASAITITSGTGGVIMGGATTGTGLGLTTSGSSASFKITDTGGNGANIKMIGDGGTTPNKYIKVSGGTFRITNSAYGADIFVLSDTGTITNAIWGGVIASVATATTQAANDNSTKVATTAYVDTARPLGAWAAAATGTITHAATDGFLDVYCTSCSGLTIVTDSAATPTTVRAQWGAGANSSTVPVRKGDYWKITGTGGTTGSYWIPLGN